MNRITDWLAGLSGASVYAVVGALVFCEDALFFGFVLPGETAVLLAGALAAQGHVSVYWVAVTVVCAAIAGDSVGYEVGRRFGPSILASRPLRAHQDRITAARDLVRRRGPVAVFLGRFVAFFRALMPAIAGMSDMRYRTFLLFNALGGLVWGVGYTALGYSAGAAYGRVAREAGRAAAIAVAAVLLIALLLWHLRRRKRTPTERDTPQTEPKAPPAEAAAGPEGALAEAAARPEGALAEAAAEAAQEPRSDAAPGVAPEARPEDPDASADSPGGAHPASGDGAPSARAPRASGDVPGPGGAHPASSTDPAPDGPPPGGGRGTDPDGAGPA